MKTKFIIAAALLISSFTYAQKDEIKALEKALKGSDFAAAKSATSAADALISNMDDKTKAKYLFLKAQAYSHEGSTDEENEIAINSLNELIEMEKGGKSNKYSGDAEEMLAKLLNDYLISANKAIEEKNYLAASKKFKNAYNLSKKDTIFLYYAASTAVNALDYETSLKYYNELKDLGFDGSETRYYAVNNETQEEELFGDKLLRDTSLKTGQYSKPSNRRTDSKRAEIVKNIALIYVSNNENDKAIAAMKDARDENPEDVGLMLSEANVHLKMGNKVKFKELIEEATKREPNNAELQFNLGVLAAEANDVENARKYYNKAIELDPNYGDAQLNMAVLILEGEAAIIEEMNGLGTSAADDKRYDQLKDKRSALYAEAVPYLKRVLEINPKNIDAARTLMNMYSALGETDKYKEMQALVSELEAGN